MKLENVKEGSNVLTRWDDSPKPIPATVMRRYRGHRGVAFTVRMQDGTVERVSADQIVG
jgi:hypothetical protein